MGQLFNYTAKVVSIHDGDTITVEVDCGFRIYTVWPLRFNRINAPELNTQAGKDAVAYLRTLLPAPGSDISIVIQTFKDPTDKYGRWLAEVNTIQLDGSLLNVNDEMVASGHAVPYNGGQK